MGTIVKFVTVEAEQVRDHLKVFGPYYHKVFTSPSVSLLVLAYNGDKLIAACSIAGTFNMASMCVSEGYRGQGVGTKLFRETIAMARKRGLNFLAGATPPNNAAALRMDFEVGFRFVKRFEDFIFIILPLNLKGELIYHLCRAVSVIFPDPFVTKVYDLAVSIYKRTLSRS